MFRVRCKDVLMTTRSVGDCSTPTSVRDSSVAAQYVPSSVASARPMTTTKTNKDASYRKQANQQKKDCK